MAAPVLASPTSKYDEVWHGYEAELAKQCGAKHLEWLAPADLRDALDDYKKSAPRTLARRMSHAEKQECRNSIAGASCFNVGDIRIAEEAHLTQQVAAHVCGHYAACREQSDCDRSGA